MRNARLDEAQSRIKIAGRNINNLRYTDDTTFMAESKEELKNLLMKVKEEKTHFYKDGQLVLLLLSRFSCVRLYATP